MKHPKHLVNRRLSLNPYGLCASLLLSGFVLAACSGTEPSQEARNNGGDTTASEPQANRKGANKKDATSKGSTNKDDATSKKKTKLKTDRPYINRLLPEAQRIQKEHGIPIDVTLAIAIHETGWGEYEIGQNNHFGLRCASDDCITLNKNGADISYETCPDEAECFNMFAKTLNKLSDGNPKNLKTVYRNGYASGPRWLKKVRGLRRQVRQTLKKAGISPTEQN